MKLLAFDTSTDTLHLGASDGQRNLTHAEPGGAQSSARIVPLAQATLHELGLGWADLDAIVMGRGPGSFTGLRTACAVAQGLAYGARRPVIPIDTLWAMAEDARQDQTEARVLAVLDARMGQFYVAAWHYQAGRWTLVEDNALKNPPEVHWPGTWLEQGSVLTAAGLGLDPLWPRLQGGSGPPRQKMTATPNAKALLRLAPHAWAEGLAVPAEGALPLYVRDKVALTMAERAAPQP
ncbi:MAG: hypothetical protein RIT26_2047 [Pseudomonadota bacterium]|jgi:tRNA threonylcarbamoyladenosine biosynthesis protein TsaB